MEIEELKEAWKNCEKNIAQSLSFSEKAVKTAIRQKSKGQVANLLKFQIIEILAAFAFITVLMPATIRNSDDSILLVSGCFVCAAMVLTIVTSLTIIFKLKKIDFGRDTILKTSQKIADLKLNIVKIDRLMLFAVPVLIFSFMPIGFKALHDIHIADHIFRTVIAVLISLPLSYFAIFIIYKKFYLQQIKELEQDINDLNQFKTGD